MIMVQWQHSRHLSAPLDRIKKMWESGLTSQNLGLYEGSTSPLNIALGDRGLTRVGFWANQDAI